jgi:hypothetical protein
LIIFIPAVLLVFAIVRFSLNLIAQFSGRGASKKPPGPIADYFGAVLAHLTANKLHSAGAAQITAARIRDSAGAIYPVRIEGHFLSGSITYGDSVVLRLRVVDGVNIVTDGENRTTGEPIRVRV